MAKGFPFAPYCVFMGERVTSRQVQRSNKLRRKFFTIVGAVLFVLLLSVGAVGCDTFGGGSAPDVSQSISSQQEIGIWVNGIGKVSVAPDIAIINMGVQTQASSVSSAQTQAKQAMNAILAALKTKGVDDADIAMSDYNLSPVYNHNNGALEGYSVANSVIVNVRDISKVGEVIDAVVGAGGNSTRINSVAFTVDQPEQYYEQAREAAISDAAERAKQIAKLSGVKRGGLVYISETISPIVSLQSTAKIDIIVSIQAVYSVG